jgi:transposase
LEDCNIKLSSVLSNVDGSTGTKVIKDIIAGITDAEQLKRHYHRKMKASKEDFALALEGKVRPHHQTMLAIIQESISSKEAIIERIDKEIDKLAETYSVEIAHLETIPGVGRDSAIAIISEIGTDMSVFPNEHHLASWSGVSPGNNESGGKKKAVKPLKVINTSKPPSLNVLGGQQG